MALARWHYVDDRRTHEVHAGFRQAEGRQEFVIREMAVGNADAQQVVETRHAIAAAWEARLHHMELESRLALLGSYWRYDAQAGGPWTKVKSLGAAADLRPVQENLLQGEARFYHFHHRTTGEDAILLEVPHRVGEAPRGFLARLDFRWPDAETGAVRILAKAVPPVLIRSVLAREHLDLQARGSEKLVFTQDFLRAHRQGWKRDTLEAYQTLLRRISEGRLEKPKPGEALPPPADSTYTDFLASLTDPRVLALHARFLAPGEEAELIRSGEVAIRRAIQQRRHKYPEQDQIYLNVLEASLLARAGLRPGQRAHVDPDVAAMVRRFAYYL